MTMDDALVCGICVEEIWPGERVVRISADICDSEEVFCDESLEFAVFHSLCVLETFRSKDCDEVPYIEEAREAMLSSSLCECCKGMMTPKNERPFRVYRGGLS